MRSSQPVGTAVLAALAPWYVLGVAALGGASVVAGAFDPDFAAPWFSLLVALAVLACFALDARQRMAGRLPDRPFAELEGPLLWTVGGWILMRLGGAYAAHLTPLVAALLAWQVATFPRRVWVFSAGAAVVLELGLTVSGRQDGYALFLHLVVFSACAAGLAWLARGEAFRRRVVEARARLDHQLAERSKAQDFGLLTAQAPAITELPRIDGVIDRASIGRMTLDFVTESFTLHLDQLRAALGLTTAAVLWRAPEADELRLRGCSSARTDLLRGPFAPGAGIPGSVLRDVGEVAVAPVHSGFGGLPYYPNTQGVGGVLAVAIPSPRRAAGDPEAAAEPVGVLCVDRESDARWTESERLVLRLAARKLALDVATGQRLKATDHERSTIGRFCAGLQELNGALGLEQVADAAIQAVRAQVPVDLSVLSVVQGDVHRVVRAHGPHAERFANLQFTSDEGLVGQAIKIEASLPVSGDYRGNQPVFTAGDRLSDMRSLFVVPLKKAEGGPPIGALTVAARAEGAFGPAHRAVLELVAAQVAVKLDLARAHEQIREMATTDGLTGLTNHRTFQQAFDNMLARARRRQSTLCLILTDIDHFKRLNDTYGHPFGDEVLRGVARVLGAAVRDVDLAARYGGEEFALILEDSDEEGGRLLAERIRQEVERLTFTHDPKGQVSVTLSLGLASWPHDGDSKVEIIARADQALYHAKHGGRNQVRTWAEVATQVPATTAANA